MSKTDRKLILKQIEEKANLNKNYTKNSLNMSNHKQMIEQGYGVYLQKRNQKLNNVLDNSSNLHRIRQRFKRQVVLDDSERKTMSPPQPMIPGKLI